MSNIKIVIQNHSNNLLSNSSLLLQNAHAVAIKNQNVHEIMNAYQKTCL